MMPLHHLMTRLMRGDGQGRRDALDHQPDLSPGRISDSVDRLAAVLKDDRTPNVLPLSDLLRSARAGLSELARGSPLLDPNMRFAVEAIILSDGSRPCVLVQDDRIDPDEPTLGDWVADVVQGSGNISAVARATACITLPGPPASPNATVIGTGFAVAPGMVATNRHVLQAIARPDGTDLGAWQFSPNCMFDFGGEYERDSQPQRHFAPGRVHFAGPDLIAQTSNPALLDVAVIELLPNGLADFPNSVPLSGPDDGLIQNGTLAVMGFPAAPAFGTVSDVVLFKLFRNVFGVKRLAPGTVTLLPGAVTGDHDPPRCFGHDASTLGGNSGSCVFDMSGGGRVVGLHFGGSQQVSNYAHAVARIADSLK